MHAWLYSVYYSDFINTWIFHDVPSIKDTSCIYFGVPSRNNDVIVIFYEHSLPTTQLIQAPVP